MLRSCAAHQTEILTCVLPSSIRLSIKPGSKSYLVNSHDGYRGCLRMLTSITGRFSRSARAIEAHRLIVTSAVWLIRLVVMAGRDRALQSLRGAGEAVQPRIQNLLVIPESARREQAPRGRSGARDKRAEESFERSEGGDWGYADDV